MTRWFENFFAQIAEKICPIVNRLGKNSPKVNKILPKNSPKWRNFAQSGHTGRINGLSLNVESRNGKGRQEDTQDRKSKSVLNVPNFFSKNQIEPFQELKLLNWRMVGTKRKFLPNSSEKGIFGLSVGNLWGQIFFKKVAKCCPRINFGPKCGLLGNFLRCFTE